MRQRYFAGVVFLFSTAGGEAALKPALRASVPPPAPVGTVVTWTADVAASQPGEVWYRFRVRPPGGAVFSMIRDYGPEDTLEWTAAEHEGAYEIEVAARDRATGEEGSASFFYEFASRVLGSEPVISPTGHPHVFLYSTLPCPAGSRMRVRFETAGVPASHTPFKECDAASSMNFYIAGLLPGAEYNLVHSVENESGATEGPPVVLGVPELQVAAPTFQVLVGVPPERGVLLHGAVFGTPVATDLAGNVIWSYPKPMSFLTRPLAGGSFFGIFQDYTAGPERQVLREIDLAGTTLRETNAARVSEQLAAMGAHPIGAFHHEAVPLPDGGVLVLASTERVVTDVQGPGAVDVIGETIVALNKDLQVTWTWDGFDHLDVSRAAVLNETCRPGAGGCPPFYLDTIANDWLHANSLQRTADGHILMSLRHQDWVIKINYSNGQGDGAILWRLGKDGDFRIQSTDSSPWFSHQHDPGFISGDNSTLALFDNGNLRNTADPSANSRGQVLHLDEENRIATLLLDADLGAYGFALGSAQRLASGNYHFNIGWLPDNSSRYVEVDPAGNIVYAMAVGVPVYRSFRMADLYTP